MPRRASWKRARLAAQGLLDAVPEARARARHGAQLDRLTLLQFLNARNLNVGKAEKMLRAALRYREENDLDGILDWQPPYCFRNFFPAGSDCERC